MRWRSLLFTIALVHGAGSRAQVHHHTSIRDTLYTKPIGAFRTFRDSLPDGVWSAYTRNSGGFFSRLIHPRIVVLQGAYEGNRRQGTFTYYDPNRRGQVQRTETYYNGVLEGEFQIFFWNGRLQTHGNYHNGLREGLWRHYDECWRRNEAGQAVELLGFYLASEIVYANGQRISTNRYSCAPAETP
jgi:hypothetical protein